MEWFKNEEEWDSYAVATKTLMLNCNKRMYIRGLLWFLIPEEGEKPKLSHWPLGLQLKPVRMWPRRCQDLGRGQKMVNPNTGRVSNQTAPTTVKDKKRCGAVPVETAMILWGRRESMAKWDLVETCNSHAFKINWQVFIVLLWFG